MKERIINVECKCGYVVFRYRKIGEGRLIKCYLPRIIEDNVGLPKHIVIGTEVLCPKCNNRIGAIMGIRGMRAVKLNQGQIKPFRLN